jgi:AcrR family transcriptional regulator
MLASALAATAKSRTQSRAAMQRGFSLTPFLIERLIKNEMPANSNKTRERILTVAERLFASHGFNGVSMRDLAAGAKVPLALISYHFGPKKALYRAVFARRYEALTEDRLKRLGEIGARRGRGDAIEAVIAAFLDPILELKTARSGVHFATLISREATDPEEAKRGIIAQYLDPTARTFLAALQRALPGAGKADVAWGYQFLIGAIVLILADTGRLTRISGGAARSDDVRAARDNLVRHAAAGFRSIARKHRSAA